jgi:hypothetical protein
VTNFPWIIAFPWIKESRSICELLMLLNALKKLIKKDFFLAIDAATQSSNKEAK